MAAQFAGLALAQVCCVRELTPVASATALLLWLRDHPDHLEGVSTLTMLAARTQVAYPERAPEAVVDLARSVLAVSRNDRVDEETLLLLAPHAREGWIAFTRWLQNAKPPAAAVIDLASERRRRRGRHADRRRHP